MSAPFAFRRQEPTGVFRRIAFLPDDQAPSEHQGSIAGLCPDIPIRLTNRGAQQKPVLAGCHRDAQSRNNCLRRFPIPEYGRWPAWPMQRSAGV
jgi:hypothetical protein